MEPCNGRLIKASLLKPLLCARHLQLAADAADIGRLCGEHLGKDLIIPLVTRRHDDRIVLRPDRDGGKDVGKVTADHLLRFRKVLRPRDLGALVDHGDAKAHVGKNRHQRTAHVSSAEEVDAPGAKERLDINAVLKVCPRGEARHIASAKLAFGEDAELTHLLSVEPQHQPGVLVPVQHGAPAPQCFEGVRLSAVQILKTHAHSAAADRADAARLIRSELIGAQLSRAA